MATTRSIDERYDTRLKPRLDALEGLRTEAAGYRRKALYLVLDWE